MPGLTLVLVHLANRHACRYGYRSPGQRRPNGSLLLALFLFCLWIIPGFLYALHHDGWHLRCPRCGARIRDDS